MKKPALVNSAGDAILHNWIDNDAFLNEMLRANDDGNAGLQPTIATTPTAAPARDPGAFVYLPTKSRD